MKKALAIILIYLSLFTIGLNAQDTIYLNGTNKVSFAVNRQVQLFFTTPTTQFNTATTTIRSVTNVGKILFKPDGSGYIIPLSTFKNGSIVYYYKGNYLERRNLVFITKSVVITPPTATDEYTLKVGSTTSAGVYQNNKLFRTLWSNEYRSAGTYKIVWDKKGDNGQLIVGEYEVQVLSHNMKYTWTANIGNNSRVDTGQHKIRGLATPYSAVECGNFIYFAKGHSEGNSPIFKVKKGDVNYNIPVRESGCGDHDMHTEFSATDGVRIYFAGYDAWSGYWNPNNPPTDTNSRVTSLIYAINLSDDKDYIFTNGKTTKGSLAQCNTYSAAGLIYDDKAMKPTGLAVMTNGNYIYSTHLGKAQIRCYNKLSGAQIGIYNIALGKITIEGNYLYGVLGNSVRKYLINSNGTLTYQNLAIAVNNPIDISVKNGRILVLDGVTMQIRAFNTDGVSLWVFGKLNGYKGNSKVEIDRFGFTDFGTTNFKGYITQLNDGSFWLGNSTNAENLHFTTNRTFIEKISYLPTNYNCGVDKNSTKVSASYLIYDGITGNLTHNFSGRIPFKYSYVNNRDIFSSMATLNGKTFALLNYYPLAPTQDEKVTTIVELTDTGLRYTNIFLDEYRKYNLESNGDLVYYEGDYWGTSGTASIMKRTFNGVSISEPITLYTFPMSASNPFYGCTNSGANSKGIIFAEHYNNKGYHYGKVGQNGWQWQTSKSMPSGYNGDFPKDGRFDATDEVQYAGWCNYVVDSLSVWNYIGEFYRGNQANIWNLYFDNGLMLMQLGMTGPQSEAYSKTSEAPREAAGNMLGAGMIKIGSDYYLFYCDESRHGAIGCFKIENYSSLVLHRIKI